MADNYLERRQAEVNEEGRARYRTASATLETLLSRTADSAVHGAYSFDPSYRVHSLQLNAIISICERFGPKDLSLRIVPGDNPHIDILSEGVSASDAKLYIDLGRCIQTASLKAAEMGLVVTFELCESESSQHEAECGNGKAGKTLAKIFVGKKSR